MNSRMAREKASPCEAWKATWQLGSRSGTSVRRLSLLAEAPPRAPYCRTHWGDLPLRHKRMTHERHHSKPLLLRSWGSWPVRKLASLTSPNFLVLRVPQAASRGPSSGIRSTRNLIDPAYVPSRKLQSGLPVGELPPWESRARPLVARRKRDSMDHATFLLAIPRRPALRVRRVCRTDFSRRRR